MNVLFPIYIIQYLVTERTLPPNTIQFYSTEHNFLLFTLLQYSPDPPDDVQVHWWLIQWISLPVEHVVYEQSRVSLHISQETIKQMNNVFIIQFFKLSLTFSFNKNM